MYEGFLKCGHAKASTQPALDPNTPAPTAVPRPGATLPTGYLAETDSAQPAPIRSSASLHQLAQAQPQRGGIDALRCHLRTVRRHQPDPLFCSDPTEAGRRRRWLCWAFGAQEHADAGRCAQRLGQRHDLAERGVPDSPSPTSLSRRMLSTSSRSSRAWRTGNALKARRSCAPYHPRRSCRRTVWPGYSVSEPAAPTRQRGSASSPPAAPPHPSDRPSPPAPVVRIPGCRAPAVQCELHPTVLLSPSEPASRQHRVPQPKPHVFELGPRALEEVAHAVPEPAATPCVRRG